MCSSSQRGRRRSHSPSSLAEEIFDELLLCRICFSAFDRPKSLSCFHVFCCKCIDSQLNAKYAYRQQQQQQQQQQRADQGREFTCPLCYRRTPLPPGGANMLPDDLTVSKLMTLIGRRRQDSCQTPSCNVCMTLNHRRSDAVSRCVDCSKLLCCQCQTQHQKTKVTSDHALFGIQVEKDIECKDHAHETIRFYCAECNDCVCVVCAFDERTHLRHSLVSLDEAVCCVRRRLQTTLDGAKTKADDCDARVETIARCEEAVAMTTQKIKETADRLIQEVREAQVRMSEQLHLSIGQDLMQQLKVKKSLESVVEGMRSTCEIADVIVAGKDMELLLLKKDVEGKLKSIAAAIQSSALPLPPSSPPPSSRSFARIQFRPGSVDVGRLHDNDGMMTSLGCSGSTKSRTIFIRQRPLHEAKTSTRDTAVQTDEETDKKTDERGGGGGGGVVRPTLPVMTVSVRSSPPKMKVDQKDEEPRRRRRRDTSQTKAPQSVSSKK